MKREIVEIFELVANEIIESGYKCEVKREYSGKCKRSSPVPALITNCPLIEVGYMFGLYKMEYEHLPQRMDLIGDHAIIY